MFDLSDVVDNRDVYWWTNPTTRNSSLDISEFGINKAINRALGGDFELFNIVEFGFLYKSVLDNLGIDSYDAGGIPVFSSNGKLIGVKLLAAKDGWNGIKNNSIEYKIDAWAFFDLNSSMIEESGFFKQLPWLYN